MNNKSKDILEDLVLQFAKGKFDSEIALKLEEIYGRWGMTFTFNVGIFLWPVSLVVTTIMFVVFIRKKLLGATQKFIMSILILDLCFVSTTAIRDTLLKVFDMNYGFLEYRVCPGVMYSIRLQMVLHATSAWLNTLMSVHHLLLVGFPLRRQTSPNCDHFTPHDCAEYFEYFWPENITKEEKLCTGPKRHENGGRPRTSWRRAVESKLKTKQKTLGSVTRLATERQR
uniref:Uncharacterized protein n=1 Tax=Magallana gigas TaxID=29159 RepID=A0A8W8NRQ2_MAGGI